MVRTGARLVRRRQPLHTPTRPSQRVMVEPSHLSLSTRRTVLRRCYLVARTTRTKMRELRKCNVRGGLAAVSCMIALVACGSSHGPSGTTGSGTSLPAVEFADCMRAHGVPSFPDPNGGGGSTSVADTGTPAFKSASRACARLAPGGSGGVRSTESQFLAAVRFAKCMRAHGVPGIPDPTRGSGPVPGGLGLGHGSVLSSESGLRPKCPGCFASSGGMRDRQVGGRSLKQKP